ncbi:helix-turn-helix domain-containing protein [Streptomyces niveus]|uniref:helix-turn-helix domain-containing protein n=1 Tax=Streptomyces niveus TaxID=193462 RepID=UPI00363FDBA7
MWPGATWHADIDLVAVDRAMTGHLPRPVLTDGEQRYAIREMTAAGAIAKDIARCLGITERTVTRWRSEDEQGSS